MIQIPACVVNNARLNRRTLAGAQVRLCSTCMQRLQGLHFECTCCINCRLLLPAWLWHISAKATDHQLTPCAAHLLLLQ
jgi:hypothetical protein